MTTSCKRSWVIATVGASVILSLFTACESTNWGHRKDERTSGQLVDDSRITSQVKQTLAQEPVYKFDDVDVKTFNGVVQLSGFVNSEQQRARAADLAQQVAGVSKVVNGLTLKPVQPATPTGRPNQAPIETNSSPNTLNRPAPAPVSR